MNDDAIIKMFNELLTKIDAVFKSLKIFVKDQREFNKQVFEFLQEQKGYNGTLEVQVKSLIERLDRLEIVINKNDPFK
ncbi:MAG: hypothetical protein DSZ21_00375 [Tenericutes bacterium]|nr:MAG: hypothetical protein DSZ21_00375 [Mycoplasmatota bacterium]